MTIMSWQPAATNSLARLHVPTVPPPPQTNGILCPAQAAPEDALFYAPGAAFTKLFPKEVMANMLVNDQHRFWRRAMNQSLSPQVCPHYRAVDRPCMGFAAFTLTFSLHSHPQIQFPAAALACCRAQHA